MHCACASRGGCVGGMRNDRELAKVYNWANLLLCYSTLCLLTVLYHLQALTSASVFVCVSEQIAQGDCALPSFLTEHYHTTKKGLKSNNCENGKIFTAVVAAFV